MSEEDLRGATCLKRYACFPSKCKQNWDANEKRIVAVGGAHCSTPFGGTLFSFVATDLYGHLILLGWGWSAEPENKADVEYYFSLFRKMYTNVRMIISDQGSAFEMLRKEINNEAKRKHDSDSAEEFPVWMGCIVHIGTAAGLRNS